MRTAAAAVKFNDARDITLFVVNKRLSISSNWGASTRTS
jgi:hypothetical protein